MNRNAMKADLHVHSKYSTRPSQWILRKIGCSESYTEPRDLYRIARARGMDLVTITDHNTIAGSLEIADLDGAFISEEITTYFPADRCKLHVLAYDITEAQHEEIGRVRENIFDLVDYLRSAGIVHVLAHALFRVNDRLTPEHFEQVLLLFKNFELNGSRDSMQNAILAGILDRLTPGKIERLADRHGLELCGPEPWKKNLTAGSDDHSSLNIASSFTEVTGAAGKSDFLEGIGGGRSSPGGRAASPQIMAHNLYSIAYQFYRDKFRFHGLVEDEAMMRFIDSALTPGRDVSEGLMNRILGYIGQRVTDGFFRADPRTMTGLIRQMARDILAGDREMKELLARKKLGPEQKSRVWFRFVNRVSERVTKHLADSLLDKVTNANLFDIFHLLGSVSSLYVMLAPYFVAYTLFSKDRRFCVTCRDSIHGKETGREPERLQIAHFTDTLYDVNGVARTLKMQVDTARRTGKDLRVITCGARSVLPGTVNFESIGSFELSEYPDIKLEYPPVLAMIDYCYEQGFSLLHSATPGPVGLAALAVARILKVPIVGTYHTAFPQYVMRMTEDDAIEELTWRYVIWYYNQMDVVYVPSHATGDELAARGIDRSKIEFYNRGIDTDLYHPSRRNGFFKRRFGLDDGVRKILYVGRVSREKGLPVLERAFRDLVSRRDDLRLVVVGDGPYLGEMKRSMQGLPATFTGLLNGVDLAEAYASADLFVFPSETDTFGNVVLEAQASGLPVIVTDRGGPQENLVPGETGFVVPAGRSESITEKALEILDDSARLDGMRREARRYMENRSFEKAWLDLWESYRTARRRA